MLLTPINRTAPFEKLKALVTSSDSIGCFDLRPIKHRVVSNMATTLLLLPYQAALMACKQSAALVPV